MIHSWFMIHINEWSMVHDYSSLFFLLHKLMNHESWIMKWICFHYHSFIHVSWIMNHEWIINHISDCVSGSPMRVDCLTWPWILNLEFVPEQHLDGNSGAAIRNATRGIQNSKWAHHHVKKQTLASSTAD